MHATLQAMDIFSKVNATNSDEMEVRRRGSMGTRGAAREDLGALEHVFDAVRRVDHIVLRQVVPHVPVLVVPSTIIKMSPVNLRVSSPSLYVLARVV